MDISLVSPLGKTVTLWQEHGGSCTHCYIQSDTWDRPSAVTYERMALIHVAVAQWAPVERKRCFWDRNDNICTHAVIVVAWVRKERVLLLFIILDILWTATHNCVCVLFLSLWLKSFDDPEIQRHRTETKCQVGFTNNPLKEPADQTPGDPHSLDPGVLQMAGGGAEPARLIFNTSSVLTILKRCLRSCLI